MQALRKDRLQVCLSLRSLSLCVPLNELLLVSLVCSHACIHICAPMGGILLSIVIVCMHDGTSNQELCRQWPKTFMSACIYNSFFAELNVC